jgi:ferredoxin
VGHAEALAALGVGFAEALILAGPRTDRATPEAQLALTRALLEGAGREAERARLIDPADPDALEETVYGARAGAMGVEPVMPLGGRRETTRLAMQALAGPEAPPIPLPEGAPYGQVIVDTDACTLCLACAGLCPVGALMDNPDKPQLRFQEDACLQCGICASGCPENAITLEPRMDLSPAAFSARLMKEEEPYACIECGKLFGVKSTIERIVEKLESKHWMYSNSDNTRLIRMCDDCRVRAQYHAEASPFRMGEPPRVRTTEDYLRERDEETPER